MAKQWLERLQEQPNATAKIFLFGELRITLLGMMSANPEAKQVYTALFPEEQKQDKHNER